MNQTYQTNASGAKKIKLFYQDFEVPSTSQYITFMAKTKHCTICLYTSNKVVFQGNNIAEEIAIWNLDADFQNTKQESSSNSKQTKDYVIKLPQCGSDEVGTGDYFGPVCVCASYIDEASFEFVRNMNITDSKALTDEYIRKIAPKLIKQIPHSVIILDNQKYNEIQPKNNLNAIKAKLHNACYVHLENKLGKLPSFCMVDQFAEEGLYYHYLKDTKKVIKGLTFETKAESHYISVAISSIIARYAFLIAMDKLSEIYQMEFPKGAGNKVDIFAKQFVAQYSFEELKKVAKIHFKNSDKLK